MGAILYASAVIIPQFAQQVSTIPRPGRDWCFRRAASCVILLIPIVGKLMTLLQTRYMIAIGFSVMGGALMFSSTLAPNIDFACWC